MAKTGYKSARNRRAPEQGTTGAPFLGAFGARISFDSVELSGVVTAIIFKPWSELVEQAQMWTQGRQIPLDAIKIERDGIWEDVETAIVGVGAVTINFTVAAGATVNQIFVIPGHPGLIGANGQQCGGAYKIPD